MAKSFKKNTPISNLAGTTPVETTPVEPITKEVPTVEVEKITKIENDPDKKNAGRPLTNPEKGRKKDYTRTINIAIDKDLLEKVNIAKAKYKDNITLYINTLIEKDLEANYDSYVTLYRMLNE